jgi:hypothetical protein
MGKSFQHMVDKDYEIKSVDEILTASPAALQGVSQADAVKMDQAFGVTTVQQMAELKYFHFAEALMAAKGYPDYDPGPPPDWQDFFARVPALKNEWLDNFRWEYGPIFYRGRLDGTARVLVIGQDPATDEALARRAFVGRSGQRLQGLLRKIGIPRSYIIVNTFIYSIYGQFDTGMRRISLDPLVLDYRNEMLDKIVKDNDIEAVITIGAAARHAFEHWPGGSKYTVFNLTHPSASDIQVVDDWNQDLQNIIDQVTPDDGAVPDNTPYGSMFTPEDHEDIPRSDLPFGIPAWHGTGGTRSHRTSPTVIVWEGPP